MGKQAPSGAEEVGGGPLLPLASRDQPQSTEQGLPPPPACCEPSTALCPTLFASRSQHLTCLSRPAENMYGWRGDTARPVTCGGRREARGQSVRVLGIGAR
jgi:hypothetical protein